MQARVVMHLPFPAADVTGLEWHAPKPIAIGGTTDDAHPHDLRLQSYAEDLGDDLRTALPHRTASADLGWAGAWVDRWSLDVACLWVVEALEVDAAWPDYRDRVNVRRRAARDRAEQRFGREPLWLCLLHVIEMEAQHDELDAVAAALTDNGDPCPLDAFPDVAVRLSLDACVAVRPADRKVAVGVARMIAVHTAIWAAAMEFDRELLPLLSGDTQAHAPLSELERRADRLRETSRRVRAFRAPLANTPAHLSELDGPMWQAVADRWALDPQLDALSGRIDALQQTHADLIAALSTGHAQRLNRIALALALISGCTAVFAVVQFVIVEPRPTEVRIANALIVLAVAAVAAWLWWTVMVSGRRRG